MFVYHRQDSLAAITLAQLQRLAVVLKQPWPIGWRDVLQAHEQISAAAFVAKQQEARRSESFDPTQAIMLSCGGLTCATLNAFKCGDVSVSTAPAFSQATYVINSQAPGVNGVILAAIAAHRKGARQVGIIESKPGPVQDIIKRLGIPWITYIVDHNLDDQYIKRKCCHCDVVIYVVTTEYNANIAKACRDARIPLAIALGGEREDLAAWHFSIIESLARS